MALPAPAVSPSNVRIKFFRGPWCQFHRFSLVPARNIPTFTISSLKLTTVAKFGKTSGMQLQMNNAKEKLWEIVPDSVKNFPWKKAENIALKQFLALAKEALKWSLIWGFVLSCTLDVIYSVSRNKELTIPLGLFVGCMMTDFIKETSQELFFNSKERGLSQILPSICCFFICIKIVSAYFLVQGRVFLLHVANGGLMQVLWLWRSLLEEQDRKSIEENSMMGDASHAMNVAD